MNKYKYLAIFLLIIFTLASYSLTLNNNYGQNTVKNVALERENSPIDTVENFWLQAEIGNLVTASSYRTDSAGELIIFANDSPSWEEIIFNTKIKFVSSKIQKIFKNESIVEVIAKDKHGNKIYFYHTVLKEDGKWKIFAIYL